MPTKTHSRTTPNKIPTDAVVGPPKSTTIVKVGIPVVEGAIAQISGVALCAVVPVYEAGNLWDNSLVRMCGREEKNGKTHAHMHEIKQVMIDCMKVQLYDSYDWMTCTLSAGGAFPQFWEVWRWLLSGL